MFVTGVTLLESYCRTDIISDVSYMRSDSGVPLVLCTVVNNI